MKERSLSSRATLTRVFLSDPDDNIFTCRFIFTLNGEAMSWKSSQQPTIVDLAIETEYIIASDTTEEAVMLKKLSKTLASSL